MKVDGQTYKWTGINHHGHHDTGTIDAVDASSAQAELKNRGIDVISLSLKSRYNFTVHQKKIKNTDIQLFTRYLSTMLSAGLPIIQALEIIGHDQEKPKMADLINSIKKNIASGKTLAETFGEHPDYFSGLYCSLIKAGEKSGTLDKILNRLAGYLERTENLKKKVKKALIYPISILFIALIVSLILLLFVVPQFQKMFESFGAKLPYFTQLVVDLSASLQSYWWIFVLIIGLFIVYWRKVLRYNETVLKYIDYISLKIYIVGTLIRKGILARFTRTLATTMEAGMPIVDSMKSMQPIMGNRLYAEAIKNICDDITSGHTLSDSMIKTKLFPNMVVQMIAVGEASGRMPDMLNKIADYYEEEVNHLVDTLSSLLEPLIMLILGVIVGGFVIAMYLPIFKIGSLF